MSHFQARICFFSFVFLFVGTVFNALVLQNAGGQKDAAVVNRTVVTAALPPSEQAPVRSAHRALKRYPDSAVSSTEPARSMVRAIQWELKGLKYRTGDADGFAGIVTRASIMAYEHDKGLTLTGEPTEALLKHMLLGAAFSSDKTNGAHGMHAIRITKIVQQALADLGYAPGAIDGMAGRSTAKAIKAFEKDRGFDQTGRISGRLIQEFKRVTTLELVS